MKKLNIQSMTQLTIQLVTQLMLVLNLSNCKSTDFNGESNKAPALPPIQTREFLQQTREIRQFNVKQGTSGRSSNENYNVTSKGVVDIVVVVDNSGSMAQEQAQLASRLSPLLSSIRESDWRIVVTTTDPEYGCGKGPISKTDSNAEARFSSFVQEAGIGGSGEEQPILQAVKALKGSCFWGPGKWLRPNSTVAVVIVSDEDNCFWDSDIGYGCAGKSSLNSTYLTNYLSSIRTVGKDARVYGIFWHPSQSSAQCSTGYKQANKLAEAVQATGGTWGSICDADYGPTLTSISRDVAQILNADFVLKSIPDPGTFKMMVNGQPWTDFTQIGLAVHFTRDPPVGATILVNYISAAAGIVAHEFEIPDVPVSDQISATVNGQPAGGVSYNEANRKVVFAQKPMDGSEIVINYKVASPLSTIFPIATNADVQTIKITVDGVLVPKEQYSYDAKTGAITFKVAPKESAKIKVEWRGSKVIS